MKNALVLAGHGSHISPMTAGLVWQQVDKLRAIGIADQVTAAFWKEMPSFATVLNTLEADDITIVPLFTAQGYFTRSVIPTEMGLQGTVTTAEGRTLRYARTLGEHPYLIEVVRRRVEDTLAMIDAARDRIGVALIGHGTRRNPTSRAATEAQAQMLRDLRLVSEVTAVYLDDTPAIPDVYRLLDTPIIIAVPNFLALGSHTTIDVPKALGLVLRQTVGEVRGRMVYYTDPIGTDGSLTNVIIELAGEAGTNLLARASGSVWDCFPTAGRDELVEEVCRRGEMRFGQLILTPREVRTDGQCHTTIVSPDVLREYVRTFPLFRPLSTSSDLPMGWRVPVSEPASIHAVVETVYPGAVADWAANRQNVFSVQVLNKVVARQQGMFQALSEFVEVEQQVRSVCGGCMRHPTWHYGATPVDAVPCCEPCNWWMSRAVETEA